MTGTRCFAAITTSPSGGLYEITPNRDPFSRAMTGLGERRRFEIIVNGVQLTLALTQTGEARGISVTVATTSVRGRGASCHKWSNGKSGFVRRGRTPSSMHLFASILRYDLAIRPCYTTRHMCICRAVTSSREHPDRWHRAVLPSRSYWLD